MEELRLLVISAAQATAECYGASIPQENMNLSMLFKFWFSWNVACLLAHTCSWKQSEDKRK
jgi:hypothetical protein